MLSYHLAATFPAHDTRLRKRHLQVTDGYYISSQHFLIKSGKEKPGHLPILPSGADKTKYRKSWYNWSIQPIGRIASCTEKAKCEN